MRDTPTTDLLELIALNDTVASFKPPVCQYGALPSLASVSGDPLCGRGLWLAIVDNRHYTHAPRTTVFLPAFTLHKVMVDEQAEAIYRRTIIHLDQHAVLKILRDFPQTRQRLERLSRRGGEAWVADLAHCHTISTICLAAINRR